jgi:hypothetical protein
MTIKEVLEHPWILKNTKGKIIELRTGIKTSYDSTFKIYTTVEDKITS